MKTVARNVVIALTLALSVVAFAQDAEPGSSSGSSVMAKNWDAQVYGDVGLHFTSISLGDFGSASNTNFGLTLGGKFTYRISDSLSVGPLANLSLVFGDGSTAVPITVAGAITVDKVLPVELSGGLGFTLYTGLAGATPAGLAIVAQALYPLPSMPNLGIHAQLVENILSDSVNLFQLTAGVAYKF